MITNIQNIFLIIYNLKGDVNIYLVKSADQALRLLHDAALNPPFHHPLDVFFLILLRHSNILTVWLQVALSNLECYRNIMFIIIFKYTPFW